jgi:hypothetical protein
MANALTKDSAAQLYLVAVIMSFLREGGLNALGQKVGDYVKFLQTHRDVVDVDQFEGLLQKSLADACAMLPLFIEDKEELKRAKRPKTRTTV